MADSSPRPAQRWRVLFLLFFLSGISGLIYESIWSRYIRQFVGSAATAQILVLSLFMGGMSLGALLAGRYIRRVRSPVLVYGMIEGVIGLYALAFPYLQAGAMRMSYDVLFPALGGGTAVVIAKWLVAALLILPPCIALGTTFPLMSVGILRRDLEHSGEVLSLLYFTNSLGASTGALLSGFVLVGRLGLPGTLMVAATLNILIMLLAIRDRDSTTPIEEREPKAAKDEPAAGLRVHVWLFLAVSFGTGLSSFMYEIGWIRLLSMVLGSATHSFEVMLSAFIFGMAMGGLFIRKRMDRYQRPEVVLAVVQLAMGLAAIITLPLYEVAVQGMGWLMDYDAGSRNILGYTLSLDRTESLWTTFNVVRYLLCLLIMFPATFCAGMTLPLLTHVMLKRGQPESAVGNVYGVNTLGAITGAVAAGLLLMPVVGIKGVILLGAIVDMGLGVWLIWNEVRSGRATGSLRRFLVTASAGTAMTVALGFAVIHVDPMVLTSTVFRHGRKELPDNYEILRYVDGRTASVTVVENTSHPGYHIIYTNGKPDASVILDRWPEDRDPEEGPDIAGDEPNQFLVGIVPLMAKPDATHAALIGFGSGVTCHVVLGSPNLQWLDTVEIEPEMVEGSRYFMPVNNRAYEDPRSHIHFDDAKAYFASAGIKYDFIISEPTNPWVSGVSSLFTVEFYQEVKRYLKPKGLLAQWLQGYELSDELMMSVLAAIDQEFEDYLVVRIGSLDWVILSSPDGEIPPLSAEVLDWPELKESFDLLGIHDVGQIDGLVVANKRLLHPFISQRTPNTDERPLLDTGAEKQRFLRVSAEFLHEMRWSPAPILPVLAGIDARPYPKDGIGDLRDTHILEEGEEAALLMRRFEENDVQIPQGLSGVTMQLWRQQAAAPDDWDAWLSATYGVYERTIPHLDVARTPWWAAVVETGLGEDAPDTVRSAVTIMDAMARHEGQRLWDAVEPTLPTTEQRHKTSMLALVGHGARVVAGIMRVLGARERAEQWWAAIELAIQKDEHPLPEGLRVLAGLIALELLQVEPARRKEYAREQMAWIGTEDTSSGFGFRVLEAYAERE